MKAQMSAIGGLSRNLVLDQRITACDPGRVETPFIPQKLQRMVVVPVDLTV